jgi:hypothetical protein
VLRTPPRHAIRRTRPQPLRHIRPAAATVTRKAAPVLSGAARVSRQTGPVVPRAVRAAGKTLLRVPTFVLAWLVVHGARYWAALSPQRKRAHVMVGGSVSFAAIVLVTSFPLSGVLAQRSALSSTANGIRTLEAQNRSLSAQAAALSQPGALDALARQEYGFVPSGERAYTVLPPTIGSPIQRTQGQVPLDEAPVVPGSAQSEALLGVPPPAAVHGRRPHASAHASQAGAEPKGYWSRVIKTLEFWS